MNNLGVEIGGNFVSFAELRSDVQACYRKGMGSNFCFLPETVEALLDYIAAQQSMHLTGGSLRDLPAVITLEDGATIKRNPAPPTRK